MDEAQIFAVGFVIGIFIVYFLLLMMTLFYQSQEKKRIKNYFTETGQWEKFNKWKEDKKKYEL